MKWRQIDTAPKDGKIFLAANFNNKPPFVAVAWFDVVHKKCFKYTGGIAVFEQNLTHWMPILPDPTEP